METCRPQRVFALSETGEIAITLNFHYPIGLSICRSTCLRSFSAMSARIVLHPSGIFVMGFLFKNLECTLDSEEEVRSGKRAIASST